MATNTQTRRAALAQGALVAYLLPRLAKDEKIDPARDLEGVTLGNIEDMIPALERRFAGRLAKDATIRGAVPLVLALDEWDDEDEEEKKKKKKDAEDGDNEKEGSREDMETRGKKTDAEDEEEDDEDEFMKKKKAKDKKAKDAKRAKDEEDDEEEKKKKAEDKRAKDDDMGDDEECEKMTKKAMDEKIKAEVTKGMKIAHDEATRTQREIREAERKVRPYVGELAMAFDSAEQVYRAAIKMMPGISPETRRAIDNVHASALPLLLEQQPLPGARTRAVDVGMAQDSGAGADFFKRFPDAARIRLG
jgi:hypothetical protein